MLGICSPLLAQMPPKELLDDLLRPKNIELKHIWQDYLFFPRQATGFNFMKDSAFYTDLEPSPDKKQLEVVKYNLKTGAPSEVLYACADTAQLSGYEWSADEQKLLLETRREQIYRHSSQANFWVYDIRTRTQVPVSEKGKQRYATFNPQADKIGFVRDNNLFFKDLQTNKEIQISKDGAINQIINGATDWVYEEEFALDRAFFWSPNGNHIAYLRFDEREVREFRLTYYKNELYPSETTFKYPKAGEKNSVVSVWVYDLKKKKSHRVNIGSDSSQYVPRLVWTADNHLCITRLNRLQNNLDLLIFDPAKPKDAPTSLLKETSSQFIDIHNILTFLPNERFVWSSDRSGNHQLYLHDMSGKEVRKLSPDNAEVTQMYGIDAKNGLVYYQLAKADQKAIQREVWVTNLQTGEAKPLTANKAGLNDAQFSRDYSYYIHSFTNAQIPPVFGVYSLANQSLVRILEDNEALQNTAKEYNWSKLEFFTIENKEGSKLNAWRLLPPNFDPTKKYPVLMYTYGGPGRQTVLDGWDGGNGAWFQMLAQKGYIVVSVDGRGTDGRAEKFRKSTYLELGKYEALDQRAAAEYLGSLAYVDKTRIGIFGWSFGGYLSTACLAKSPDVFKLAIAVAPVINWKWYDTIYTERYMRTPKENPKGYEENSPINFAQNIVGKYLLIHGTGDDNVHAQNAFEMVRVLVEKNIPFSQAFYTNKSHGISGGKTRLHLYEQMTKFILENL
jgi:dipeptidyl-peptidase-4